MKSLKESKPGDVVVLLGVVTGQHNGQTVVEFDAGDQTHGVLKEPISWHVTNSVCAHDWHALAQAKDRYGSILSAVVAKAQRVIGSLPREAERG